MKKLAWLLVFLLAPMLAHAQCAGISGQNTINNCPQATSLSRSDLLLGWQNVQSPHTRNMTISQVFALLNIGDITGGLGYTPLKPANNLSDLSSASSSRTNLGLGTMATQNAGAVAITGGTISGASLTGSTISLGQVTGALGFTPLNPANNLSELASAATARTNLGLGSVATSNSINLSTQVTNNLAVTSLNSGTFASSLTYWRGDGTWVTPPGTISLFGTGMDGNVTISSGTTTLTRDMFYNTLTISGTGKIKTAGFRIYVLGTLTLTGAGTDAISNNGVDGNAASGATAGTAATPQQDLTGSILALYPSSSGLGAGGAGSTGTAAGSNSAAVAGSTNPTVFLGGLGGAGGVGGAGASSAAGSIGSTSGVLALTNSGVLVTFDTIGTRSGLPGATTTASRSYPGINGPGGSGGGGGGSGQTGGGGGSSGLGGGHVYIAASVIARSGSTSGIISARGGNGGAGGTAAGTNAGGGGGGPGGGGGLVQIIAGSLTGSTATNAVDVSGGAGAAGGNGTGTGSGGAGGAGGQGGGFVLMVLSPASGTVVIAPQGVSGGAGGAASGTTGGSAGTAGTSKGNL